MTNRLVIGAAAAVAAAAVAGFAGGYLTATDEVVETTLTAPTVRGADEPVTVTGGRPGNLPALPPRAERPAPPPIPRPSPTPSPSPSPGPAPAPAPRPSPGPVSPF